MPNEDEEEYHDNAHPVPEAYRVPGEVAIAVMTRRAEFLDMLKKRVQEGLVIPQEQILALIDMVGEEMVLRERFRQGVIRAADGLEGMATGIRTIKARIDAAFELENGPRRKHER